MALKFNLANQLMSPEQMAGFGQSFGESLGGIGMALGDAWSNYQAEQDKAASIVDPATGRVPLTLEAESEEFDEDIQVNDPSFGDVNLGEDIGRIKSWYEKQAEEDGDMNITPRAMIGGRVTPDIDTASDIRSLLQVAGVPTAETPTASDVQHYNTAMGGYQGPGFQMGVDKSRGFSAPEFQATMKDYPDYRQMLWDIGDKHYSYNTGTGEYRLSSQSPEEAFLQKARSGELEEQYSDSLGALGMTADEFGRNLRDKYMMPGPQFK